MMAMSMCGGTVGTNCWSLALCIVIQAQHLQLWYGGAIGYESHLCLVCISGTLTSQSYISDVLEPMVVPYFQDFRDTTYQQDNVQLHVACNIRHFLDRQHVPLLPWPVHSPDLC